MAHSEQINEIAAALAKAQALIKGAEKDRLNPHFKSQYATLDSVWKACREPLTANGLSVVQTIETGEHGPVMESILLHSSGQWISSTLAIRGDLDNVQKLGSVLTYLRRYSLSALVGVAPTDDDDGNEAAAGPMHSQRPAQSRPPQRPTPRPQPAQEIGPARIADMMLIDIRALPAVADVEAWADSNMRFVHDLPQDLGEMVKAELDKQHNSLAALQAEAEEGR